MQVRYRVAIAVGLFTTAAASFRESPVFAGEPAAIRQAATAPFIVKPYFQLGDASPGKAVEGLALLWHANDIDEDWAIEYQSSSEVLWHQAQAPAIERIAIPTIAPHRVYRAILQGLRPGEEFRYRVCKRGVTVFEAVGHGPVGKEQPYRFVAFGDCGAGTPEEKAVAYQAYRAEPNFVMITGDLVYDQGRISEYRERFWPVYNADEASPPGGGPLCRSTLFIAAPGNHDIGNRDLGKYPDGLAYFLYWDQPRNGPLGSEGGPLVPLLKGPEQNKALFIKAAAGKYPRIANFSFDYGNAHWTILDSNPYVDWTNPELRSWVEQDLAAAQTATWRFVAYHHPGFNSAKSHFGDQQMRLLADLFEKGKVDVVFSGHVHNYQRSDPIRFTALRDREGKLIRIDNKVPGRWMLDKTFDGRAHTRPQGVIYLITGGGGNHLYNPEQQDDPASWQNFTVKFVSKIHSLTIADVSGPNLTVRQMSLLGEELDRFVVTK
jgi:acid phosphatase type 7